MSLLDFTPGDSFAIPVPYTRKMTDSKDNPKKNSLIKSHWWLMFFYLLPFLAVGGFWGFLQHYNLIEDVGRDGGEMGLFAPEAVKVFLAAMLEHGMTPGLIGLSIGIAGTFLYRIAKKIKSSGAS